MSQLENLKSKIENLKSGRIVAVKGIGGFHLACDARNSDAVEELRRRKGRGDKPFAVMCRDLETAKRIAHVSDSEADLLESRERPIVLIPAIPGALPESIAPGNRFVGIMLPYAPLHHLLFDNGPDVLVMTSGNLSNEPIVKDNDEALEKLANLADAFLLHDRDIFVQSDDSVVAILDFGFRILDLKAESKAKWEPKSKSNWEPKSKADWEPNSKLDSKQDSSDRQQIDQSKIQNPKSQILPIRRSRGYAPFPVELPFRLPQVMAVGGELKAAFCLTRGNFAFMSQHIGDMENLETLEAFENASEQMKRLFRVEPEIVAGDLHPNYLSSSWARRRFPNFVGVQHHEAHIASVMAENGLGTDDSVIGFAFDGTGFGTDGNIWGGEVFVGGYKRFDRPAHLRYFPLAGGDVSIRNVYRVALGLLRECGIGWSPELPSVAACTETELAILEKQFDRRLNVVNTSSFGRLFDAVASLSGVRQTASYEAQAAIEFEALLDENEAESYRFEIVGGEIDWRPVIEAAVRDLQAGFASGRVSAKFHNGIADLIIRLSRKLSLETGIRRIALTGGCFQNSALVCRSVIGLERDGFEVLTHRIVPPNDAGLALGQAVLAGIRISDL